MKKSTYTKIGAFSLATLVLAAAAVFYIGKKGSGGEELLFETYIEETVQGISEGSQVKYRGIPVGTVKSVSFALERYTTEGDSPEERRAMRYARIVFTIAVDDPERKKMFANLLREQVEDGLRAHTKTKGLTGLAYLDLDYEPPGRPELPVPWEPEHPYIPIAPSLVKTLTEVVQNVAQEIHSVSEVKVPLTNLLAETTALVVTLREDGHRSLETAQELMEEIKTQGGSAAGKAERLMDETTRSLDRLAPSLAETLDNLARATGDFAGLAEDLRADPGKILRRQPRDTLP